MCEFSNFIENQHQNIKILKNIKQGNFETDIFKKGPFSKSEQFLVNEAMKKVLEEEGYQFNIEDPGNIFDLTKRNLPKNFWGKVAMYVPGRRVESIYDHTRRRMSFQNYQGKWTEEEVIHLKELVQFYGHQWTKIGTTLNRLPGACYDKWRDALKSGQRRNKGKWSQEEKCKLIQLVSIQIGHEIIQEPGIEKSIRWTLIAEKIGTRSYLQCRNEWSRFFSPGSKIKLTLFDSFKLIETMCSLQVTDESEIKWGELLQGVPAHKTYNKWRSLCKKFFKKNQKTDFFHISFEHQIFFIREKLQGNL